MANKIDFLWDDNPVDVTQEANFIWSIANKLRGVYMPDKYGDVVIPMVVLRRFECTLEPTKDKVVAEFEKNPATPKQKMYKLTGYQFYNTSKFTLKELCNDADHIASNLKAYIAGFSANVVDIFNELEFSGQIEKMAKGGCLYSTVKAFSELDLSPATYDSIKMGYIFENLIGRFFQNVDAGQFYTGRDIIKTLVSILISEGCDDIFESGKEITVCDQACGTGGMLSTAYSYLKHYNPNCNVGKNYDKDVAVKAMLQVKDIMMKSEELKASALVNEPNDFEFTYFDNIDDALVEGLEQNKDFFTLLLDNEDVKKEVLGIFANEIYRSFRGETDS